MRSEPPVGGSVVDFICTLTMPEEGVVFLLGATVSEPCLLESSKVDIEMVPLSIGYGSLAGVVGVVKAV